MPVVASRRQINVVARASSPAKTVTSKTAAGTKAGTAKGPATTKGTAKVPATTKGAQTAKGTALAPAAKKTRAPTVGEVKERNPNKLPGQFYFNFTGFPFPIGPFFTRRTIRNEVRES